MKLESAAADRFPTPNGPPEPWYRDGLVVTLVVALVLAIAGTAAVTTIWALGNRDAVAEVASASTASATTTPAGSDPSTVAPAIPADSSTVPSPSMAAPVPSSVPPTTVPSLPPSTPPPTTAPPTNPYGDAVGVAIADPATVPARFASARATGGDPAGIATPFSPAYFVLVWARWGADAARPTVTASDIGYVVETTAGPQILSKFVLDDTGEHVRDVALTSVGTPPDPSAQAHADGTCAEGESDCAGFRPSGWSPVADLNGSTHQLWRLATVGLDPATNVWIMIPETPDGTTVASIAPLVGEATIDPSTGWIFMSYGKNPPGGSADQRLDVTLTDGTMLAFEFTVT